MTISRQLVLAVSVALVALTAISDADAQRRRRAAAPAVSAQCSDFYTYANDNWLKTHPLTDATPSISTLGQLGERALLQQRDLLNDAMTAPSNDAQKLLGDFWASGLDEAAVEADGANPIAPLLARINAIRRSRDIPASIAALHQVGIPVAFNFSPDIDLRALDRHIGYFMQGGTGLPDPAFYTRDDAPTHDLRERYRAYIQQILALTGTPQNQLDSESRAVLALETRLARNAKPLTDINNPFSNYDPVPVSDLNRRFRNLQLGAFLKAQGVNDDLVSMSDPALFEQLNAMITQVAPAQWKAYMRWYVGDAMAPYLSRSFRDASFEFRGRTLRGQTQQPERWQQVLDAINTAAGPMLGHAYAARYLPQASEHEAEAIATAVRQAELAALERSTWLSADAKAEARAKIDRLKIEIGLPHRDLDYTIQPMGRGSFGSNILIASTWRHREEMKRIGHGNADRRWDVLPQQPALTYDIAQNRLIVTAAVLQPPVFDIGADRASRFGAYGALVGNQLGRAVDNKGSLVDASGELRSWWTPADKTAWNELGTRLVNQFNNYAFPSLPSGTGTRINGQLTLSENLSDLAGLELAWDAFSQTMPEANTASKQEFFKGWAQLWAQQMTPMAAAEWLTSDPHAPGQWRVNGPLSNLPVFGSAFSCKAGQPMRRAEADQIRIWP
ncbi:MAG: M13 family metallopeptidase [Xanthomonadaceae bacterium]|jgi:putative endopeptidase|nr:M13 family metallopeptidase [Xanthomonadaceae bacterium]